MLKRRMLNPGALLLAGVAFAAAGPALATHDVPSQAKKFQSTLVTSYEPCVAPNTMTLSLGLPACSPPVRSNPGCGFAGLGKGKLKAGVSGSGSTQVVKIKGKLAGLEPGCEGATLSLSVTVRATTDDCAAPPCTVQDVFTTDFPTGVSCTVTGGECELSGTVGTPVLAPGTSTNLQFHGCALLAGGVTRTFECGVLFP